MAYSSSNLDLNSFFKTQGQETGLDPTVGVLMAYVNMGQMAQLGPYYELRLDRWFSFRHLFHYLPVRFSRTCDCDWLSVAISDDIGRNFQLSGSDVGISVSLRKIEEDRWNGSCKSS